MPIVKNLKRHKILLDTHVWLWVMNGSSRLTNGFRRSFEHALILITTAHLENAVLVTCDEKILRYGKDKFFNVHDPS